MLRNYLRQIAPAVSLSYIERAAGLPENTLRPFVRGERGLSKAHVFPLMKALIKIFGVVAIDGWRYTSDEDSPVIFATFDEGEPASEEVGKGFVYYQKQYRAVYDSVDIVEAIFS